MSEQSRRLMLSAVVMSGSMFASAGCQPAPAIAPSSFQSPATPYRIVDTLREAKIDCEITKESLVHCKVDGVDVLLATVLGPMGMQLIMAVPFPQPACAVAEFHAKLDAYNARYAMVNAGCVSEKVLLISQRSHLFRGGLSRADLQDLVKRWVPFVVASVNESRLLAYEGGTEPAPKKSKKKSQQSPGGGTI